MEMILVKIRRFITEMFRGHDKRRERLFSGQFPPACERKGMLLLEPGQVDLAQGGQEDEAQRHRHGFAHGDF